VNRFAGVIAAALLVLVAGCTSGSDSVPTPEPTASPTTSATASPSPSTKPAADCLEGEYKLVRFVAVNDQASFGTGEGGDIRVEFGEKTYTLTAAGKEPVTLTLAGQQGKLLVDGSVNGTYTLNGNDATFKVGQAKGSATVELAGRQQTLTMGDVGNVLAPNGKATLACNDQGLIVLLSEIRLEFVPA
jgi:hypothetical protein